MFDNVRAWLSINLIYVGIRICPYEEMRDYLRKGLNLGIDSYFDSEDVSE